MSNPNPTHIRVKEIGLCDFQAFPGPDYTVVNLEQGGQGKGLSLLLYGENGSGKSSLGRALRDMLGDASRSADSFDRSRHAFSEPPSPLRSVTLTFDDPSQPVMKWCPDDSGHTRHPLFEAMSKSRGWMDYRTLWNALQFRFSQDFADVFSALADTLLLDCQVPAMTNLTFGTLWGRIRGRADKRPTTGFLPDDLELLKRDITLFSAKLSAFLPLLQDRANELLSRFVPWTAVTLKLERPPVYSSSKRSNKFSTGTISLKVTFRSKQLITLDGFLNEARITAIALSLFLAAMTLSTPPRLANGTFFPRLLVLDDILISLDMAHRRPLLDILAEHFSEWQIFLLTHDRGWYELARQKLRGGWIYRELYAIRVGDDERPLIKDDLDHIDRAETFLLNGEPKAAAVHLRTAFEALLKRFCQEFSILVPFTTNHRDITLRGLWSAIEATKWEYQPANQPKLVRKNGVWTPLAVKAVPLSIIPRQLSDRIDLALSWVLNPLSHSESIDRYRDELFDAADCLRALSAHFGHIESLGLPRYLTLMRERDKLVRLLKFRSANENAQSDAPS
jgi:energy-coupling factor transporter ATP-binding protein EcfA2